MEKAITSGDLVYSVDNLKKYLDILRHITHDFFSKEINLTPCLSYRDLHGYIIMFIGHKEFLRKHSHLLASYTEQIEQINNLLNGFVPQLIKQYEIIGEKCNNGELLSGLSINFDKNFYRNCNGTSSYYKNESGEIVLSCKENGPSLKPMLPQEICGKNILYPLGNSTKLIAL